MKPDFTPRSSGLLPVDEALSLLQQMVQPVCSAQNVPTADALHKILAEDVIATVNVPPHANSAMDGYAFDYASRPQDGVLPVVGIVAAGHPFSGSVPAASAVRILTGAAIPDGVDSVIMQEECQITPDGRLQLPPNVRQGQHIRPVGDDVQAGQVVLTQGRRLRPQDLGIVSAIGQQQIAVFSPLRVAVFSTGDEIHPPGQPLPPGGIYDSNRTTALALLRSLGCLVTDLGILPDDRAVIAAALDRAAQSHDLIVTSGGVSVGDEDHVKAAVQQHGTLAFWKLAIKPGKPLAIGTVGRSVFLGLPGNPVAVMVAFMLVGRPLVLRMMGANDVSVPRIPVQAGFDWARRAGRREWLRGKVFLQDGALWAEKFPSDGSGVLSSMVWSDGLIEIPESCDRVQMGQILSYIPYAELLR